MTPGEEPARCTTRRLTQVQGLGANSVPHLLLERIMKMSKPPFCLNWPVAPICLKQTGQETDRWQEMEAGLPTNLGSRLTVLIPPRSAGLVIKM